MPDDTTTATTPEGKTVQINETTETETKSYTPPKDQEEFDYRVRDRIRREREKFADYDDLKNKAAEFDKLQEASKSEIDKEREARAASESRIAALDRDLQEMRVERAVLRVANKHGVVDTDDAVKLLDWSAIDFDKEGQPTNVDQLIAQLVKDKPYLAGSRRQSADFDAGARTTAPNDAREMNDLIRQAAGR